MGRTSKRLRVKDYTRAIPLYPEWVRQAQIARSLGLARSFVLRDLPYLEAMGVLLVEDDANRLSRVTREILLT